MTRQRNTPHGGVLVDLLATPERARELRKLSLEWPDWRLTPRQLCDVELLACGAFSPLTGFLGPEDYTSVCERLRLADGTLWPMPVVLDVDEATAGRLPIGATLALRDPEGLLIAALTVEHVWSPDREAEAAAVYGTTDRTHPGVEALLGRTNPCYVSGPLEVVGLPVHHDFAELRITPAALRRRLAGHERVVAFQTRNPMHRAHLELTTRAAAAARAHLLIQPVVGQTKPGDVDHYTRVRCYRALLDSYPAGSASLALLPLAMRMGGPREALWHAIIRKNYGVTHFVVGRDHAGPGRDSAGRPFYGPYDAQRLLATHQAELGVTMVPFRMMVYLADEDRYVTEDEVPAGARVLSISGTEQRERLRRGEDLPSWFTPPAVAAELRRRYPPRQHTGVTVFLTGLSGAGKSTIANVLLVKLLERGGRSVTLLDGDLVRTHLSSELGFSKEHRDLNVRRIGFVAAEITRHGGIAVCAPIAPYAQTRRQVREMVQAGGGFVLVHVATDIETCEARDAKGLYAKARAGLLPNFTGVSDPYEPPDDADIVIDAGTVPPGRAAERIMAHLEAAGYLAAG